MSYSDSLLLLLALFIVDLLYLLFYLGFAFWLKLHLQLETSQDAIVISNTRAVEDCHGGGGGFKGVLSIFQTDW